MDYFFLAHALIFELAHPFINIGELSRRKEGRKSVQSEPIIVMQQHNCTLYFAT